MNVLFYIVFCLLTQQTICTEHISYTQRIPLYHTEHDEHTYMNDETNEYAYSMVASAFLGAANGLLCRQFEKKILQDFLLFRLINICIWGTAQSALIDTITTDLQNQNIKHSPTMMKKIAWLMSWISYLLVD